MNIAPGIMPPFHREPAKPAALRADAAQPSGSTKPIKAVDQSEQKAAPPGLERVLARLQSIPVAERSAGQANATEKISRNMARYTEIEAISTLPATPSDAIAAERPD